MKVVVCLVALLACVSVSLPASADTSGSNSGGTSGGVQKAKKRKPPVEDEEEAAPPARSGDIAGVPPAAVLSEGSNVLSARIGVGSITFGGLDYERMVTNNIGVIGDFRYGGYSNDFTIGGLSATWKYTVWALAVQGAFHCDLLKVPNLDTYVSLGLVRGFVSSRLTTSATGTFTPTVQADGSFWDLVAYLNARYFFAPNFGATLSLGTGLGTAASGVDYLF